MKTLSGMRAAAGLCCGFVSAIPAIGATPESASIPEVEIQRDVPYLAAERSERLDLYLPANRGRGTKSPAVVVIHGGGWLKGSQSAPREIDTSTILARAGYVCASIDYEILPGENWPTNLHDSKNAVRFLRVHAEKYGIDCDRIGAIGGSAGGHLALMVAYTWNLKELAPPRPYPGVSDRVQACVNLYGVTNLLTRQFTEPDGTPNGKLKGGLIPEENDPAGVRRQMASPVFHVRKDCPPTLTLHGTADTIVDRDQAAELEKRLAEAGVVHETIMVPGAPHTFLLSDLEPALREKTIAFFDRHLKGKR